MLRVVLLLGLLFEIAAGRAQAQWYVVAYRPLGVHYRVLRSPHFELIYPHGREAEAQAAAALLEAHYDSARALVGVRHDFRVPVILSDYRDRGNGFVSALPFRQEFDIARLRGLAVAPTARSWLHAVAPHELVHAAHAEFNAGIGIGWGLRLLGPDWSRLLNLWVPAGFAEGVAVFYESQIEGGAGRLHFPFFSMEFRAAMASKQPWRLAQLLEASAYTWPFDRHYNGGGHLHQYLIENGQLDFFQRTLRWFHRMPLAGFGLAFWYGTRQFPATLGQRFRQTFREQILQDLARRGPFTEARVVRSERGLILRRPYWLDDRTLVAYAFGYQEQPGYYQIDAETGRMQRIRTFATTEDYLYTLTPDRQALLVARYIPDPLLSGRLPAEIYRIGLKGDVERLTYGGRVYAPVLAPDGSVWALQNEGSYNRWVRITPGGHITPVVVLKGVFWVQLAPSPKGDRVAVLLNQRGRQGLFEAQFAPDGHVTLHPWLAFRQGAIYDVNWSADGRWLLFTADLDSIPNIYALDVTSGQVRRLTNVAFGALEPALSPDGQWLAFIRYQHERYELVRIPFRPEDAPEVSATHLAPFALQHFEPEATDQVRFEGPSQPYRPWRYLWRPRLTYLVGSLPQSDPDGFGEGLDWALGLGLEGTDPLQRWRYGAHGFYQQERLWGSLWLSYGGWPFRPGLYLYDLPTSALVRFSDGTIRRVGRERRGVAFSAELPLLLNANVHSSWMLLTLMGRSEYERYFWHRQPSHPTLLDDTRQTLEPIATVAYRLQQNLRDLMPNQGLRWTTQALWDLRRTTLPRRTAYRSSLYLYLPLLARYNVGLRLDAGLLWQNRTNIYELTTFLPRGWENVLLGRGTFGRLGALALVPLKFIDNGLVLLPVYVEALYLYGFAETVRALNGKPPEARDFSAVGGGAGLHLRLFSHLRLDLRAGVAYRLGTGSWEVVWR